MLPWLLLFHRVVNFDREEYKQSRNENKYHERKSFLYPFGHSNLPTCINEQSMEGLDVTRRINSSKPPILFIIRKYNSFNNNMKLWLFEADVLVMLL